MSRPSLASHRADARSIPGSERIPSSSKAPSKKSAQISLTRRLLFPTLPLNTPVPPILASSPKVPGIDALNTEIYDFLALAMRGFVNPWWGKITARDKDFLQEVTRIVTHVVRSLETRLVLADITGMVIHDIPMLLAQHFADYHACQEKLRTNYVTGLQEYSSMSSSTPNLPYLFHNLQPHMAVAADGTVDGTYMRQAVEFIMMSCLPPQDWAAETERAIVREIIVKILLESIATKLSQPWFMHKLLLEALGPPKEPRTNPSFGSMNGSTNSFSIHSLIIIILSAIQLISGFALSFLALVQSGRQMFQRIKATPKSKRGGRKKETKELATPSVELLAEILTMRERAASSAVYGMLQLIVGFSNPLLDQVIPHLVQTNITVQKITQVVVIAKKVLFPNGYPGPPPVEPTPDEQMQMRAELDARLFQLFPSIAAKVLLGTTEDSQRRTVKSILGPLDSKECNTHLIILILDLVLVTIFPELEQGIGGEVYSDGLASTRLQAGVGGDSSSLGTSHDRNSSMVDEEPSDKA